MSSAQLIRAADSVDAALHALRALDDLLTASRDEAFHRLAYLTGPVVDLLADGQTHLEAARASAPAVATAKTKE